MKYGYFEGFEGLKTYYEIHGQITQSSTVIVAIHGGPGFTHHHLSNISKVAKKNITVILYDQIGCGKSSKLTDHNKYSVDLFVNELKGLLEFLKLDNVVLLGHSWGSVVAFEYYLRFSRRVQGIIFSSPVIDTRIWEHEAKKLVKQLPLWASTVLLSKAKNEIDYYNIFQMAYDEYIFRHICRARPYPEELIKSESQMDIYAYKRLWGDTEIEVTGTLKGYTMLDRISAINCPVLFLRGEYDEVTMPQIEPAIKLVSQSKFYEFKKCSHSSNLESEVEYNDVLLKFLRELDHEQIKKSS